jgi:hypothetical protein
LGALELSRMWQAYPRFSDGWAGERRRIIDEMERYAGSFLDELSAKHGVPRPRLVIYVPRRTSGTRRSYFLTP